MAENRSAPDFRQALSRFATGVTVITYRDRDGFPHGLTVSSFNSVSLDPQLILWSIGGKSSHFDAFQIGEKFVVNVLSAEGASHAMDFFGRKNDIFNRVPFTLNQYDIPVLSQVSAAFSCSVNKRVEAGDHDIIVGEVSDFRCQDSAPLIFANGKFCEQGPAIEMG